MTRTRLLAVVPARGGSKGLPGKNIRPFAGLPLIAHTIQFAKLCAGIDRCIVSTDSPEIASVARGYGGEVPFLRPAELAEDETPMWAVVRHALAAIERQEGNPYDVLLLLDPTSPAREPADLAGALERLSGAPDADGVIGVSRPEFNPIWHCVVEQNGWMTDLFEAGPGIDRRQEAPPVFRINGSLYVWRTPFVRREPHSWRRRGRHLLFEIPERRAMSIDTADEFDRAEALVNSGLVVLPWLQEPQRCAPLPSSRI